MPKPKQKRIIVLQSSYSATNVVANLNLTMDASFDTAASVLTTNLFQDLSTAGNETSRYKMAFKLVSGANVGELTLSFAGRGENLASGVSMTKSATSSSDPPATTAT